MKENNEAKFEVVTQQYDIATLVSSANIISKVSEIELSVKAEIESLNIDALEATEENKAKIRALRIKLNADRAKLEEDVKQIKQIVNEPVVLLESEMKTRVKKLYEENIELLKKKIADIEDIQLQENLNYAKDYYEAKITATPLRVGGRYEDIPWDFKFGSSKKSIRDTVDKHFANIEKDLFIIDNHEHSVQLEELWIKNSFDLGLALTELQKRIIMAEKLMKDREAKLEAERREQELRARELERQKEDLESRLEEIEEVKEVEQQIITAEEINDYFFKIELTNTQLERFVNYLVQSDIDFELVEK